MRAPQHPGTALQSRSLLLTVEPVDSPHLILGDGLFASQGGVDVHEGVGVQRVHEAQGVSDLVGCHMDQVCEPNSWGKRKTSWNCASCQSTTGVQLCFIPQFLLVENQGKDFSTRTGNSAPVSSSL